MFSNYFLIAWRRLVALPLFSVINIGGLAVGIACFVLAMLFVQDELSFDRFWPKADRIFIVETDVRVANGGDPVHFERTYPQVGPLVAANIAGVDAVARTAALGFLVGAGDVRHYEDVEFIDPSLFEVFDLEFVAGTADDALSGPMTVVLTESYARKYFGAVPPLNRHVTLDGKYLFRVAGVVKDLPRNTHLNLGVISNVSSMEAMIYADDLKQWRSPNVRTYVLFADGEHSRRAKAAMPAFAKSNLPAGLAERVALSLTEIGLLRERRSGFGGVNTLSMPLVIGAIVLLMACINAINLAIARGAERMKELGVRKVLGASRSKLAFQFLTESMTLACVSLLVAVVLVEISLPLLNPVFDKELELNFLTNGKLFAELLLITCATGVLSGAYPAFVLSGFNAADVFKRNVYFGHSTTSFRSVMVALQFSMALILSIATSFVYLQMNYVRNLKLGFDDANIVVLENVGWTEIQPQYETLRNELLKNENIQSVSASLAVPGREFDRVSDFYVAGSETGGKFSLSRLSIDYDFFKTYGIRMVAGRDFSRDYAMDTVRPASDGTRPVFNVVINESALRRLQLGSADEALDRVLVSSDKTWSFDVRIVGVVSDFHIQGGHGAISPYVYVISPTVVRFASIRISGRNLRSTLSYIDETWNRVIPTYPIVRSFLRDDLQTAFTRWERTGSVMAALSMLAILIALLGCFAMAAYSTKCRSREIGLRKVLGASSSHIVSLLTLEFSRPVIIANLFAWPLAYVAVRTWLEGYSYRIDIGWHVFLLNGLVSFVLSALVVSALTLSAARMNPVTVMRHE